MGGRAAKMLTLDVVFVVRGLAAASVVQPATWCSWRSGACGKSVVVPLQKCVVPGMNGELVGWFVATVVLPL